MLLLLTPLMDPAPEGSQVPQWWSFPLVAELHPNWPTPLLQHRRWMVEVSSGPRASPLYRDTWARMDTCWAFVTENQRCPALSEDEQDRARDLAIASALTGAQLMINLRVDEAEMLSVVRDLSRTVTSPNLELRKQPEGLSLRANQARPVFNAVEQARAAELPVARPSGPPPSSLRLGSAGTLRSEDDLDERANTTLAWNTWVQATQFGPDALRLSVDLARWDPGAPKPFAWTLSWSVSARQELVPGWTLSAEARSGEDSSPLLLRGGLAWAFWNQDPTWLLRLVGTNNFPTPARPEGERRVELRLQWNGPWRTPSDPDRWPLGQDLQATRSAWPSHPGWGPNTLNPPLRPADVQQAMRVGGP